ncbi:dienelactone hydrolase family protein [Dyadobacter sp. CY356]|uniref:dienelactone hydrolase family protein n=1 Tax=Dyadobacter sp. CY356 TaxID=2906442 RepID=UPI001F2C2E4A|nr:dienelactone hydrolase family protein [Dyadobacter sp. CY356]MCF0056419.1 dienelactone hydrolase family protein [Dyadobacter sp. CY356]
MKISKFYLAPAFLLMTTMSFAQLQPVNYADGAQKLSGFVAKPKTAAKKKAGVLVLPAWMGIDAHAKTSAEDLSAMGYYAFVADIYGVDKRPTDMKGAGELAGYYKKNIAEYQKRIKLALEQLIKAGADPANIAVIGYCFGGTGAVEAARENFPVKGIVSFHGGLSKDSTRAVSAIKPKLLILHGADDNYVPAKEVAAFQNEMRKANADWEMNYYANSVHSFTDPAAGTDNSKGAAYNEKAAKRSWKAMQDFFDEIF